MRTCLICGEQFLPTGRADKYCQAEECRRELRRRYNLAQRTKNKPESVGKGKGGTNKKGREHAQFTHGYGDFNRLRVEVKAEERWCSTCGCDLLMADRHHWCVHHKDHNHKNNVRENLTLLCKRCHQLEHKCWEAFERATTIREE